MIFFRLRLFCLIFCLAVASNSFSNPPEKSPKKWPCDQVYNPKLNLQSIWQGPSIENALKDWWKDDEVIGIVNKLSDPILKEDDGIKIIEDFAKKYTYLGLIKKASQSEKLTFLFAALYQKAADNRRRQYVGILKFVDRQESFREAIGKASKRIRKYRKEKLDLKHPNVLEATSQLEWNTRVFDQRTRLTEYICEEPVFTSQRLGYQSRKIASYLK